MKRNYLLVLVCILTIFSCRRATNFSEEFNLETNSSVRNSKDMDLLKSELEISDSSKVNGNEKAYLATSPSDLKYEVVVLKNAVSQLFDPENGFCTLPDEVAKRFKTLKAKGKSWAPGYVVKFIKEIPDSAMYLPRASISVLLHSFKIKSTNGNIRNWVAFGAETFNSLDVDRFILSKGYNSFFYSLDCSGYLNAALEGAGSVAIADIRASAKSALEQKKSMFIGGGVLISPIAAAYFGSSLGINLDTLERVQILRQIESIPNVTDNDSIILKSNYEAIWMSLEGTSSFNGEASFGGEAKVGLGVASLSSKGDTGAEVSRKSSFHSFKTYFTKRSIVSELQPFTIKDVKAQRKILEKAH